MRVATISLVALWSVCASAGENTGAAAGTSSAVQRQAPDLSGSWALRIENLQHKLIVTMTVQFKEATAPSCIGGNWKRVAVTARSSSEEKFFPITEPISYELNGDKLSIGRNEVCDGYLRLDGQLKGNAARGEYYSFGMHSVKQLGYFSLNRGH